MVEEVISERHKEISIAAVKPDSDLIQRSQMSKMKKSTVSVAKLNSSTHILEFSYDAIWGDGITYKDVTL